MKAFLSCERYHDFSAGHRVVGHEGKCALLHGHNYRVHFKVRAAPNDSSLQLDSVGRVIDFGALKATICRWIEDNWDHRFLAWEKDPLIKHLSQFMARGSDAGIMLNDSIVWVPFNPTAENMAKYLLEVVGPQVLPLTIKLFEVLIEETRKCSATATF